MAVKSTVGTVHEVEPIDGPRRPRGRRHQSPQPRRGAPLPARPLHASGARGARPSLADGAAPGAERPVPRDRPPGPDEHGHRDAGRAVAPPRHRRLPDRARPGEAEAAVSTNGFTPRRRERPAHPGRPVEGTDGGALAPAVRRRRARLRDDRARARRAVRQRAGRPACSCGRTTSRSTSRTASSTSASRARTSSSRRRRASRRSRSSASRAAPFRRRCRTTRRSRSWPRSTGSGSPPRIRSRPRHASAGSACRRRSSPSPGRSRRRRGSASPMRSSTSSRPARPRARTACA